MSKICLASCVALTLLLQVGCATGLFGSGRSTREAAIRACMEEVPADAVPYAEAFSDCMGRRGWTYAGPIDPRE